MRTCLNTLNIFYKGSKTHRLSSFFPHKEDTIPIGANVRNYKFYANCFPKNHEFVEFCTKKLKIRFQTNHGAMGYDWGLRIKYYLIGNTSKYGAISKLEEALIKPPNIIKWMEKTQRASK